MCSSWISTEIRRLRLAAAVCLAFCWLAPFAVAQETQPSLPPESSPPSQPAPPPQSAPPPQQPGVFQSLGRWFDQGASSFQEHLRGAKQRMDDLTDATAANNKELSDQAAKVGQGALDVGKGAVDATTDAVGAVAKLPTARLMSGRERCAVAPNGAPDCLAAAETLCRKHGFGSGKSMDFTSAEECPASTLLGQTSRDECTTVTFIGRAMCQ
jgi:hypothetical protein